MPEVVGFVKRARGLLSLMAWWALAAQVAFAANPQPYKVDWVSSGNDAVDSMMKATSQLATLRKTAPTDPFGLIARARGDVPRLLTVLQSFGYYDGSITITINGMGLNSVGLGNTLSSLPKGTDAHVKIRSTLGPLFHLGRITVKGALPPGMRGKLRLKTGAPAVASDVLAAGSALQTALADSGYAFAKVDKPIAYERPAQHILDITFPVTTGPRVEIGRIHVQGLQHVRESLVRRRLLLHTGEQYDAATVEKTRQDLLTLGVFSSVSVRMGKPTARNRVPLTFIVQEAKRYTVGVSAAYSSDLGGSAGFNWGDRDVFGGGEQLTASVDAINLGGSATAGLGYDATIGYAIPDFRRRDQTLSFQLRGLRQALLAYTQTGEIAGASLNRKLSSVWTLNAGITFEHEIIDQVGVGYKYNLGMLPLTANYDSTDLASPLMDPTHGFRISLNVTPTYSYGAAGKTYVVVQGSIATYYDVHKLIGSDPPGRTVLAARAISGVALGTTQFSLPPDQRFYAGGSGTVRGYRYQSIGPQFPHTDIPMGGTNMQAVNLELRQRVGTNFGFVAFVDSGGVSSPSGSVYGVGVGTGVRYYTSIGPIRFDIAVPARRLPGGDTFEIYIGLGQAF
ncbi:MAG TPA: BamA/TamA family outer membrane protein [Steroidobacteraceae bacterium]|nr:BamA/TamA family outer membrane protein [Steroidobacteraceae bacterium]